MKSYPFARRRGRIKLQIVSDRIQEVGGSYRMLIVNPAHTPMSNLLLGILDKLGIHQDTFGDSTGMLEI